jgi:HEAT repeat protein
MTVFDSKSAATHQAIRALGSHHEPGVLAALAFAATIKDQFLRRTAMETIGHHPQGRDLKTYILSGLDDQSEYVVRTACDVVEQWGLLEAHDLVLPLLTNASVATRQSAIRTLGAIWVDTDFPLLFGIYNGDPGIAVRREAASVLRRTVSAATWRTLFDAFCIDELARHRRWACELAESFSNAETLPALSSLLSDVGRPRPKRGGTRDRDHFRSK